MSFLTSPYDFLFLLLSAKTLHMIILWLAFVVNEKIAQERFITAMYIDNTDGTDRATPPPLWQLAVSVFIADSIAVALVLMALFLITSRLITDDIVGGAHLMKLVALDQLVALCLAFSVATVLANISQNQTCCRFKDDGIRGIRAYVFAALSVSIILCIPPYFMLFV